MLSNAKLIERARRYKELKAAAEKLDEAAKVERDAVIAELDRREVRTFEHAGVTVTKGQRTTTVYDPVAVKAKVKPSVWRRLVQVKVDHKTVVAEVEAGRLTHELLEGCSTRVRGAAYPVVTEKPVS